MEKRNRRRFTPAFKARVAVEAVKEHQTIAEIARRHKLHPGQVTQWKKQLLDQASAAFDTELNKDTEEEHGLLLRKIGELTVERDFLAKGLGRSR